MTDLNQRLDRDGFLVLENVFSSGDVGEVAGRLDALWGRFDRLPASHASDIAVGAAPAGRPRSPEINRAIGLDRELRDTAVYRRCRDLARELRGKLAAYVFDHAIAKAPQGNVETPWHQDQAFIGHQTALRTVHFWIPLQDVDEQNGCMHFIAGSHRAGLIEHERLVSAGGSEVFRARHVDLSASVSAPMAAGGMTVHTPLTLHYTSPNRTTVNRRAWILHFGPMGWMAKLNPVLLAEKYLRRR